MSRSETDLDRVDLVALVWCEAPAMIEEHFASLASELGEAWRGRCVLVINGEGSARTAAAARAQVRVHWPAATKVVIELRRNVGFGRAIDLGVSRAAGEFVAVFNPDGIVRPGAVSILQRALDDHPRAIAAGATIRPLSWSDPPPPVGPRPDVVEERWLPGGAGLYRRAAFLEIGGFDPRYFLYGEDLDLSWRAAGRGLLLLRAPAAEFLHEGRRSSRREEFRRTRLFAEYEGLAVLQHAPSVRAGVRRLLGMRRGWLGALYRRRNWLGLAAGSTGTAAALGLLFHVMRRRRAPWTGPALQEWLRREAAAMVEDPPRSSSREDGDHHLEAP